MRSPGAGLVVILLLLVAIVVTIVLFDRSSRTAALLLVPYLLWVCFATALNFAFWFLNS
jgi:benzodiazapine receptor